jgi:hypothetical protein
VRKGLPDRKVLRGSKVFQVHRAIKARLVRKVSKVPEARKARRARKEFQVRREK